MGHRSCVPWCINWHDVFEMTHTKHLRLRHTRTLLHIALFVFGILFLGLTQAFAQVPQESPKAGAHKYQWKKDWSDDNCTSYSSEVEGKGFVAAKVVCEMAARFEVLATILRDIDNYPEWMTDCESAKVLRVVDDERDTLVFWFHQHVPLLRDRDMVVRTSVSTDYAKGKHVIDVYSTEETPFDAGKNLYRMPSFYAQYTLDVIDREHTRVEFLIDPDLGSGMPAGIANTFVKKIPYKSIVNMRRVATEKKYVERAKLSKYAKGIEASLKSSGKFAQ